jgi:alkylation response protein AidB-like acyl-CoA dehydrogenase
MSTQDFDPLAAARSVRDDLTRHAAAAERDGRLADDAVSALTRAGLLKLWRPVGLGGHEVTPVTYGVAAEEVARTDSAAAWLMMATANTTFDLRLADPAFVEEVFAADDVVLCETFNRPMTGRSVAGGIEVSGTAPFASGCRHAHWLGHTATVDDRLMLVFHPAGTLSIEDDWHTLGMRGTASNSVTARDVFVPQHRIIDFSGSPQRNEHFPGPLFRMPEGILTATFAPVSLGLLAAALDEVTALAERKTPFASPTALKHRTQAQSDYGRALASYRAARALYRQTLDAAFDRAQAGLEFSMTDKADLFLTCAHVLQSCAAATRLVARAAGTSAIREGSAIERARRDTEVIAHHAFGAHGRFATVAQTYWGLDPDFPLLAMD